MTDPSRECRCAPPDIQRYHNRLSGPLLDRIDIHIDVPAVKYQELTRGRTGEPSRDVRARVVAARQCQLERFAGREGGYCDAQLHTRDLERHCRLDESTTGLLERAMAGSGLSARAYHRILKVARTIADLAGKAELDAESISEAIGYRTLDRSMWKQ